MDVKRTEEWETNEEVGDHEGCRSVETIGALLYKSCPVFNVGRHVGDGHEGHEG